MSDELLVLLRGRCLDTAIRDASELVHWIRANWPPLADCADDQQARILRQLILDAVEACLEPKSLIPVVKIMIGQSMADPARTTRQRVLREMAAAMPRERYADGPAYSTRRIEQLEREVIGPAVEAALRLFLGKSPQPGKDPWHDYDLKVTLRSHSSNPELVTMRTSMEFTARMRQTVIAVTTDELLADGLCQDLPEVTEVFVPSENWAVETIAVQVHDVGHWRPMPLHQLAADARQDVLKTELLDDNDLVLYASDSRPNNRSSRWRIISDQEVTVAEHYCYWSAARPLFLRTVTFDYSAFPYHQQFLFDIKSRLGRRIHVRHDAGLNTFDVEVDAWVSAGNAVELTWRDAR
jgi:hypothetical protein